MDRREALTSLSAATVGLLSGCTDQLESSSDSSGSGEPTAREKTDVHYESAEKELSLGDWYSQRKYAFAVTNFEEKEFFKDTVNGTSGEFPDGKKLAIAYLSAKNISAEEQFFPGQFLNPFFFILPSGVREATGSIEHPKYDDGLDLDWLESPSAIPRYPHSGGDKMKSGDKQAFWIAALAEEDLDLSKVTIGLNQQNPGEFEVVWS